MIAVIAAIDVLDDLLAPVRLDVDVDVGWPVSFGGQKPFEQQPQRHRIGIGDAEHITDHRVRGRPPTLTQDVRATTELDDVPHDEEVAGEPELFDDVEFMVELGIGVRAVHGAEPGEPLGARGAVVTLRTVGDETAQIHHLAERATVVALRTRVGRQTRSDQTQIEGAFEAEARRRGDHPWVPGKSRRLFGPRPKMSEPAAGQPPVDLVQAGACPDCGERRSQTTLLRRRVVHVVGGDDLTPVAQRQLDERVVSCPVERIAVIPQFHRHVLASEGRHEPQQFAFRRGRTRGAQGGRHRALTASGEHEMISAPHVSGGPGGSPQRYRQIVIGDAWRVLLAGHLRHADGPRQARVAPRVTGQHDEVLPRRIRHRRAPTSAPARTPTGSAPVDATMGTVDGEFGPEDRRQPHRPGGLGEANHPVETVVIAQCQRFEPQPRRLLDEFLGVRRPVEKTEIGMGMQLGIGHRRRRPHGVGLIGQTVARPRRAVGTVAGVGFAAMAGLNRVGQSAAQRRFELLPRHRPVVEPHPPHHRRTFVRLRRCVRGPDL